MIFLTLLIIPTLVAFIAFVAFEKKITLKEFCLQLAIQVVVIGLLTVILRHANTHDTEIQNGVVAQKEHHHVSCEHSYQCNCYESCTGSGEHESCTQICQTCYEHSYDVDWDVHTTNRETINIERVDRQGLEEPPRFTAVRVGEPTSQSYSFENYIKAAPGSLFRHQGLIEKYKGKLPEYPADIYDYYRLNRVVAIGFSLPNSGGWNTMLSTVNGALGVHKQVNVILVLVKGQPLEYYSALEQYWLGGKKNDVIVIMGVDDSSTTLKATWTQVMSWSNKEIFKVTLRDDLTDLSDKKGLTFESVGDIIIMDVNKYYVRRHWEDFKYLMSSATPTKWQWILSFIFSLLLAVGLSWVFDQNDVFDDPNDKNHERGYCE